MKYLLIALLALTACSKSKETPATGPVILRVSVMGIEAVDATHKRLDFNFNASTAVTSSGNVVVEWDEYSGSSFIKHHTQGASVVFAGNSAYVYKTPVIVEKDNIAKNTKITALSLNGGYDWRY